MTVTDDRYLNIRSDVRYAARRMDIFSATIVVSIAIYLAVGNYAGRGVKKLDDYYVAGRRAPTLLIVGTLVASVMSSTVFLGEAGFTYEGQMGPFVLFPQAATAGYIVGALLFGRYLRRSRAPTVADYFGQRFDSHRVQLAAGITVIVALGGYLVVVTQGAAILLSDLTGLSYTEALIVAWLSYTAFTMYSGSRGVILTDTLMFLLFTAASVIVAAYLVDSFGGIAATVEALARQDAKPGIASWHGIVGPGTEWPTPLDYLIWAIAIDIGWGVGYGVSPWQAGRNLMARDEHVVIRAAVYTCIVVGLLQIVIYGAGGIVNLAKPDIEPTDTVLIWASTNLVPKFFGALLMAGIMAAALSSASTFLSLVGFSASNDLVDHHEKSERQAVNVSRLIMLITGVVALAITFVFPPSLFWVTYFIGTVFASSWGPVGFMSVWSRRITKDGAFWGIVSGFLANAVPWYFDFTGAITLPSWANPIFIGITVSLVVTIVVSRMNTVTAVEHAYREQLHRVPEEDRDPRLIRRTLATVLLLVAYGCVMPLVLQYWYVRPYQRGTGQLDADGSLQFGTGEMILTYTWPMVYIPLGLLTWYVVRRSYVRR
ncbi:MAG: sodium:solute symporter family protein [Woeseiaceae bacterium]|nr:sodium:solute symporter family protein [Woeseiaceae bacterium]